MRRNQLSDLVIFVEVVRCRGFRAAAKKLQLGAGSVSEAVQRFEDRLGVRLLERSTRTLALTSAGDQLYRRSVQAVDDLEHAVREIDEQPNVVSGVLRLSAPRSSGMFILDTLLIQYGKRFPHVRVELVYDDQKIDLLRSGMDAALRSKPLLDQNTYAVPIGPEMPMSVVASPAYLEERGAPAHPEELAKHDGICFSFGGAEQLAQWTFSGEDGAMTVMPQPRIVVNDLHSMLNFCEAGLGLTYTYAKAVRTHVRDQRLIPVLSTYMPSLPRFYINYATKRHMPARLRALIDLAKTIKTPLIDFGQADS